MNESDLKIFKKYSKDKDGSEVLMGNGEQELQSEGV